MQKIDNFINGKITPPKDKEYMPNYEPATGEAYSEVALSKKEDVEEAVAAAQSAFKSWSCLPSEKRASYLQAIANRIEEHLEDFAQAESKDTGKPISLARTVDIPRAISNFRFFAAAAIQFASEAHPMDTRAINYTLRQPVGVVGCISPWNLPLYLLTWKIAPALAAGCTVVAKPSELTPMTAFLLSKVCQEIELPAGVLNIIQGKGNEAGAAITGHPQIKAISFTGGTATGATIAAQVATQFKKLSLELGGKNPTIIFEDCDYADALQTAISAAFSNQGQICLCGSRILIQASIYEKFRNDFVALAQNLLPQDPLLPETKLGAVISKEHQQKILSYIQIARQEGGKILCGGNSIVLEGRCQNGWFVAPTVIEGLDYTCTANQEEIFGPVVTLLPFETEEELLQIANGTPYGLAANLWTNNLKRAHRLGALLEFGIIWVNCWMLRDLRTPFGGVKNSGLGREGGFEAMRFFTEPKNICIKLG
ncbi:MAG: aldehyde dehydrogenase [Bacteroidia bacterium]|nr:aldehyde dehydrogenase [Bacteroidia bacterium]MDW8158798.1 aldehyde dehydrogenase [Bacteroidia bacterium]